MDGGEADVREVPVREAREEVGVELDMEAFEQCGLRIGHDGNMAFLVRSRSPLSWRDIQVHEGAGAGFFVLDGIAQLPVIRSVSHYLEHDPAVFSAN